MVELWIFILLAYNTYFLIMMIQLSTATDCVVSCISHLVSCTYI